MHDKILALNEALTQLTKVVNTYSIIYDFAVQENRGPIDPSFAVKNIQRILTETKLSEKLKPFEYEVTVDGE